jgi:methanogenic corrinoid protein MtbC1
MADQSKNNSAQRQHVPSGDAPVDALATHVLSMIAKKNAESAAQLDLDIAERLRDVAAEPTVNTVPELISKMLKAGISPDTIATVYIPHAARQMGEDWCNDNLSFARVTIGTARLQSSLRALGTDWTSQGYPDERHADGGAIVIIAKDPYHTLGAMVLCGQLRRMGLSVRLAMGVSTQELRKLFFDTSFDAALISASASESLESLREYVDVIRQSSAVCPPIIVGGNVLDQDEDVKAATGADLTTRDPVEALEHCGIPRSSYKEKLQQKRRT